MNMRWAGFSSGLANGFQNGTKMSKTIADLVKEYGINKELAAQKEKAKLASVAGQNALIVEKPQGEPVITPDPNAPDPKPAVAANPNPAADNTTPSGNTPKPVEIAPLQPMQSEAQPSQPATPEQPVTPAPVSAMEPAPAAMEVTQIEPPLTALSADNVWWSNNA